MADTLATAHLREPAGFGGLLTGTLARTSPHFLIDQLASRVAFDD